MKVTISKWGNSLAVRLPKSFTSTLGIQENEQVDLELYENHIALIPQSLTLEALLEKFEESQIHEEASFGTVTGKEVW